MPNQSFCSGQCFLRWVQRSARATKVRGSSQIDFCKLLHSNEKGDTVLIIASRCGRLEVVRMLVKEMGAKLDTKNHGGDTALVVASRSGHSEVVRMLVNEMNTKMGTVDQADTAYDHAKTEEIRCDSDGIREERRLFCDY